MALASNDLPGSHPVPVVGGSDPGQCPDCCLAFGDVPVVRGLDPLREPEELEKSGVWVGASIGSCAVPAPYKNEWISDAADPGVHCGCGCGVPGEQGYERRVDCTEGSMAFLDQRGVLPPSKDRLGSSVRGLERGVVQPEQSAGSVVSRSGSVPGLDGEVSCGGGSRDLSKLDRDNRAVLLGWVPGIHAAYGSILGGFQLGGYPWPVLRGWFPFKTRHVGNERRTQGGNVEGRDRAVVVESADRAWGYPSELRKSSESSKRWGKLFHLFRSVRGLLRAWITGDCGLDCPCWLDRQEPAVEREGSGAPVCMGLSVPKLAGFSKDDSPGLRFTGSSGDQESGVGQ